MSLLQRLRPMLLPNRRRRVVRRLRSSGHQLSRKLRGQYTSVIYHSLYRSPSKGLVDQQRGERVVDYLLERRYLPEEDIVEPSEIPIETLARVHDHDYLADLDRPDGMTRVFGSRIPPSLAPKVIAQQRRMVAGTVLAAQSVVGRSGHMAVNLGGGLHHAHADSGGGFCIFNDVAVAIATLRHEGFAGRVLIVDLDLHQGDGTRRIFAEDARVFTLSVHATDWDEEPAVADLNVALGPAIGDRGYLRAVRKNLTHAFRLASPDLVFYVAGVDIANDDQLGSWQVTPAGILRRDQTVLSHIGRTPCVWVLAGGYGREAWRHTARSLAAHLGHDDRPIPSAIERDLDHYRRIAERFEVEELSGPDDDPFQIRLEDIIGDLARVHRETRFLGFYTKHGVELALERYGILPHLRTLGFERFTVQLDLEHAIGHRVCLRTDDLREDLLIELIVREVDNVKPYRLLSIEWLLMQNPRSRASNTRPLLPGQDHPGLGCLRELVGMLVIVCERLGFDGLLFAPSHYHVAAVVRGLLTFIDPSVQGRFLALEQALEGHSLEVASMLVSVGNVVDEVAEKRLVWRGDPMVLAVSGGLKVHLDSREYEEEANRAARAQRLAITPDESQAVR